MTDKPPQKWPHYALWANEDAVACFAEIDAKLKEAMDLLRQGRTVDAVILIADARGKAADGRIVLHKGRVGER